jgi:opacity protein-like surface antigen
VENRRGAHRRAPTGILGLLGLAALGLAGAASAQDTGPYLLLGSGFGIVGDLETDLGPDTADIEYDDAGLADLSLGWRVLRHLRLEANVNYRQHHIANVDGEGLDGFAHKGDLHVLGALGNVIVDYPLGAQIERDSLPYGIPYVGVGVGMLWTKPRAELRTTPERKIRGEGTEFAWNVLAGVDVPLTRRVGLQIGYRYLESLDQSWKLRVGASTTGDVDSPYRAHEGRVGLRIGY